MEIGLSHELDLECKDLIEALHVLRMGIDEIMTNAKVDGEIRHHKLCTSRKAKSHPLVPRRQDDIIFRWFLLLITYRCSLYFHVRTTIVRTIERSTDIQPVVNMIKGIERETCHPIDSGKSSRDASKLHTRSNPTPSVCQKLATLQTRDAFPHD